MKKQQLIILTIFTIIFSINQSNAQIAIPTQYDTIMTMTGNPEMSFSMIYPKNWIKKENKAYKGRYTVTAKNLKGSIFFTMLSTDISLKENYENTLKETEEDPTKKIGLKIVKQDWFVISYQKGSTINYLKKRIVVDAYGENRIFYLEFEYPESERKVFDAIIPKLTKYNPTQ